MLPCSSVFLSTNPYTATELVKIICFILNLSAAAQTFLAPSTFTSSYLVLGSILSLCSAAKFIIKSYPSIELNVLIFVTSRYFMGLVSFDLNQKYHNQ